MAAFGVPSLAICWLLWRRQRSAETASVSAGANPFELGEAIRFGLLFGVVTFVAKAAQVYLGDAGLYLAGAIAGLTDVDAIALSMAQLAPPTPRSTERRRAHDRDRGRVEHALQGRHGRRRRRAELRRLFFPSAATLLAAGVLALFLVG